MRWVEPWYMAYALLGASAGATGTALAGWVAARFGMVAVPLLAAIGVTLGLLSLTTRRWLDGPGTRPQPGR